jgi:type I restriction enzyme S subunit
MEVKPGYKQTEVGVIPEDWDVMPLDSISRVMSGKRLPAGYFVTDSETPHPYIRVSDMRPGKVITDEIKYVPLEAFPPISQYRIFKEDLFVSVAGTLGLVGKITEELDGANLTENADRITSISCDQDYLLYVLLSPIIQRVF